MLSIQDKNSREMEKERLKIPSFVIPLKRSLRPKNSKRRGNFLFLLGRSKIKYTLKIIYPILSHLSKFDFSILILTSIYITVK